MKLIHIFITVAILSFMSCDPPIFLVSIDNRYKKEIEFDCGKIDVECNTLGGVSFTIKQVYRITNSLDVSPKKLSIKYKNNDIKYTVYLNGTLINERGKIRNDDVVVVCFTKKVQKNDTIIVNLNDFLHCNGNPINTGNIFFVVDNKHFWNKFHKK